jgi:hypothetical protein
MQSAAGGVRFTGKDFVKLSFGLLEEHYKPEGYLIINVPEHPEHYTGCIKTQRQNFRNGLLI